MFKGNKHVWRCLALLVALCMLPTVAFADPETANTISVNGQWAEYIESDNTVTVTGTISDPEADVTILAVRSATGYTNDDTGYDAAKLDLEHMEGPDLQAKVVYIDQESFTDENGTFTFEFIPRSGVAGGKIVVFVGGENVNDIQVITLDAAVQAPDVTPVTPWYKGEDLKLQITKAGTTDPYGNGDQDAIDAWFAAINALNVNGNNVKENATLAGDVITITGIEGVVTAIAITTTDGEYSEETWTGSVAQADKPAGTMTAVKSSIIAGVEEAQFTLAESTVEGWLANAAANVTVNGVEAAADLVETTLTVTLPAFPDDAESVAYTVKIAVPNYEEKTANITAVAPTKVDADALTAPAVAYSTETFVTDDPAYADYIATWDETAEGALEEKSSLFGAASVTLPAAGENGTAIAWTIDNEPAAGTVDLARAASDAQEPKTTYAAVATISKAGYKDITKEFTLNVNQCGIAGIDVAITLTMPAAAAELATVTVDGVAATRDGLTFTATAITDGLDHIIHVERPGYVTLDIALTVENGEVTSNTTIAMIAGDLNDDGAVNGRDVGILGGAWDTQTGDEKWNPKADLNGDGAVNGRDVGILGGNWDYTRAE